MRISPVRGSLKKCFELLSGIELSESTVMQLKREDINQILRKIQDNHAYAPKPDASWSQNRALLGLSMTCFKRLANRGDYIFTFPPHLFYEKGKLLHQYAMVTCCYLPELILHLEISDPAETIFSHIDKSVIPEQAFRNLLLTYLQMIELEDCGWLTWELAHFFFAGSKHYMEKLSSLTMLRLFREDEIDDYILSIKPDPKIDLALGLHYHSDFLTDSAFFYENTIKSIKSLNADDRHLKTMGAGLFLIELNEIKLPLFMPRSKEEVSLVRNTMPMQKLHNFWHYICTECREIDFSDASFTKEVKLVADHRLAEIRDMMESIAHQSEFQDLCTKRKYLIKHHILVVVLPQSLLTILPLPFTFQVANAASSGLHFFSHWFSRRFGNQARGSIAQVLTLAGAVD